MAVKGVCQHMRFRVSLSVARLSHVEGGPVESYMADLAIMCAECELPFRFLGLKPGASRFEPMVSADALELRAPLEPAIVPELLGQPLVSGRA